MEQMSVQMQIENIHSVEVLNVRYDNLMVDEALRKSLFLLEGGQKTNIYFLNLDCLHKALEDDYYRNILNSSDLLLPDGIGLRMATKLFGHRMKDNCNGSDFAPLLMMEATKANLTLFLLGGITGVAEKAAVNLKKAIPGIRIVGTNSGYFENDETIIAKINNSKAAILFVAMGAPLQEKWIYRNRQQLSPRLCLGVGALLDYLSGQKIRAPKIMRLLCLEWLWRILIEPRRMTRRYLIDGLYFMVYLMLIRLVYGSNVKNP